MKTTNDSALAHLMEIRGYGGARQTLGLSDELVSRHAERDPRLARAAREAVERHRQLRTDHDDLLKLDESELAAHLQGRILQFYGEHDVNPYVPLAARGPWIVTSHGAVLHDSGGYGMLGLGHGPDDLIATMAQPQVMANVMTPSFEQHRITELLNREVGRTRKACPFASFVFLNSGSEAMAVASRIADINTRRLTDPGARHEGKTVKLLSMQGSFHGRTDRPAQASSSTLRHYRLHLASWRDRDNLLMVEPNDIEGIRRVFAEADATGVFIESVLLEPVMGEGDPGHAIEPAFYTVARRLAEEHGSVFIVDSIQAGLRACGELSIVDYPGFEDCPPPDMETWSKALNGGQYPLSALGLTEHAASIFVRGVYGNTMTANPRSLAVACRVLESLTPELRTNIRERGQQCLAELDKLAQDFPDLIEGVQGTGLLFSLAFRPDRVTVTGPVGLEAWCRWNGIGVIHGGLNSLRFTPHFGITAEEVELIVGVVRRGGESFAES